MTDDLFIVKDGPFVGAYDRDLEVVIDFVYQSLKVYDDGFVLFRKLYLFGVMDKQYNILMKLINILMQTSMFSSNHIN